MSIPASAKVFANGQLSDMTLLDWIAIWVFVVRMSGGGECPPHQAYLLAQSLIDQSLLSFPGVPSQVHPSGSVGNA